MIDPERLADRRDAAAYQTRSLDWRTLDRERNPRTGLDAELVPRGLRSPSTPRPLREAF